MSPQTTREVRGEKDLKVFMTNSEGSCSKKIERFDLF